jgi:hypothetical protein
MVHIDGWPATDQHSGMNPETQLDAMIARYTPGIADQARSILSVMAARYPQAKRLVYDNYNALAIGFAPNDKASSGIFSIAIYPRWISLFFLQGAALADPDGLLKGRGSTVRHVVLEGADHLDRPELRALMDMAVLAAKIPYPPEGTGELIIKSISAKQRPRRP